MFDKYKLGIVIILLMLTLLITEIIHRINEYHTNIFHGWNEYRLGDCIQDLKQRNNIESKHLKYFPNSIATKYMNKTKKKDDYNVLYEIVKSYTNTTPKDVIIIHLRLGDVHERNHIKRYNDYYYDMDSLNYIIDNFKKYNNINKVILVGGSHKKFNNYDNSEKYINDVETLFKSKGFSVEHRFGNNPDEDFIYMSNAKHFIKCGKRGRFSYLIAKMVKKNGGTIYG